MTSWSALDAELERIRATHREPRWRSLLGFLGVLATLVVPGLVAIVAGIVLLWALPVLLNPVVLVVGLLMVAGGGVGHVRSRCSINASVKHRA